MRGAGGGAAAGGSVQTRAPRQPIRILGALAAAVVAAGLVAGCGSSDPQAGPIASDRPPTGTPGVVTNVVDGDTLDVSGVGRVRMVGIDTPERGACGYESATMALSARVLGRRVDLVAAGPDDTDRYGRLLRYVEVAGDDVGLRLIEDGWAVARYDSRDGYGAHPREVGYVGADRASRDLGCYPDDEP